MERYKMVETNKIIESEFNIVESNKFIQEKLDNFIEKFGSFKILVVCEIDGKYKIIDGNKAFKSYKKLNLKKVLCYNLGKTPLEYEVGYRILLNSHFERLDYLGISNAINEICNNHHESIKMTNISGIPINDVERYRDLINFDWNDFLSKKVESSQIDMFNLINE